MGDTGGDTSLMALNCLELMTSYLYPEINKKDCLNNWMTMIKTVDNTIKYMIVMIRIWLTTKIKNDWK